MIIRRTAALTALLAAGAGTPLARPTGQTPPAAQTPQQPVFRSGTDLVTVPVSIRSRRMPVAGLTSDDFVVLDNGVPQTVEVVSGESVPADVTLVVETSAAISPYLKSMEEQVRNIASMMRPGDRLEVLGVSSYVRTILPLRPASDRSPVPSLSGGGLSAINDALIAALLREPNPQRPHLIVALTDTIDTISATTMQTVRDVARYSSSILTIAWITMDLLPSQIGEPPVARTTAERQTAHMRVAMAIGEPSARLHGGISRPAAGSVGSNARTQPRTGGWHPHYEPPIGRRVTAFDPLKEAAESTGGRLYMPGVFADRTASAIFNKLYSDYRHGYVLRYTATGEVAIGWHDVSVTLPKLPGAEISAKRGYHVEKR